MKRYILLILSFAFLFLPFSTIAQSPENQLRVSPVLLNVELSPGKTYTYTVTIENLQDTPVPLRLNLDSLSTDDDGEFDFVTPKNSPLVEWTSISPREILIPANGIQEIMVTVQIPDKVQLGGYYAFLFLDPVINQNKTSSTVTARIGIPILANVGVIDNAKNHTHIDLFSFTRRIVENPTISTKLRVKNTGLHHYSVKPTLLIKPLFGTIVEVPYEEKVLFPGKGRWWEGTNTINGLIPGFYNTSMRVSTGNGDQIFYDDFFVILPYRFVLFAIVLATFVLFVIIRRDRVVKAIQIILKRER